MPAGRGVRAPAAPKPSPRDATARREGRSGPPRPAAPPLSRIAATLRYLRRCQAARAAGYPVSYTTDSAWLVTMALNRRAGWPDDPSLTRGSCMPVDGKYPAKASGDPYNHLRLIANEINTPRLIVREARLGEWRAYFLKRLPHRITRRGEE